jgi:MraZ protein
MASVHAVSAGDRAGEQGPCLLGQGPQVQIEHAFLSHALNAVDAKGRVSVPSSFRSTVDLRVRTYGIAGDEVRATELMIGMHSDGDRLRAYDVVGTRQLMTEIAEGVADLPARERREALEQGAAFRNFHAAAGRL